jgi:DNA-binding response OmpR family regulator
MSLERSETLTGAVAPVQRPNNRLRLAVLDRDPGFMQVLSNRLGALGGEYRALSVPATADALVSMRLNALVLDLAVLGPGGWEYLERICSRLPGMAVIVCTGPSSVAQRVRGLRLGADAWISKPCHAEEFEILNLLTGSDRVLRREEIYERVWGYAMAHGDRSVDVFVRKLRQKLRTASPAWNYIHTHFGVGYRFAPEHEAAVEPELDLVSRARSGELDPALAG